MNIKTNTSNTFLDLHSERYRPRDKQSCFDQFSHIFERNEFSGLNGTNFTLVHIKEHFLDGANFTLIDVEIGCNKELTPWCEC